MGFDFSTAGPQQGEDGPVTPPTSKDWGQPAPESPPWEDIQLADKPYAKVPQEMMGIRQWVCWKTVEVPGKPKPTKVPIDALTSHQAKVNDQKTWCGLNDAANYFDEWKDAEHVHVDGKTGAEVEGKIMGVGFVFSATDDYCGIDLDNCVNDSGTIEPWAADIVQKINSYTEISPSGTGLHIIAKGSLPSGFNRGNVEGYDRLRYFTVTGDIYQNRQFINRRDAQLTAFYRQYSNKGDQCHQQQENADRPYGGVSVDAATVLKRALRSKHADNIQLMLDGGLCKNHPSDSDRDLALCNHLVFFCGNVPNDEKLRVVDEIIRDNSLFRDKWDVVHRPADGATYGRMTIQKAIEGSFNRYMTLAERRLNETEKDSTIMERLGITVSNLVDAAYDEQKGCSNIFIRLKKDQYCFDHATGIWYQFQSHCWAREDIGAPVKDIDEVQLLLKRAVAEISNQILILGEERKENIDLIEKDIIGPKIKMLETQEATVRSVNRKLNRLVFRKQVVEFSAQGPGTLGITGNEWDCAPWELACKNGIVDLKTGTIRPGLPQDYIKSPCPTAYDPNAKCPQFQRFLYEIFGGDHELVEFARRVFGMALIGSSFQKQYLVIFSGQGRNGKDTLISITGHVLGPNLFGVIAPETLLDNGKFGSRNPSGPSPDIMRLRGLRIAWASETSQGRRFNAGKAKMLTGGGSIIGRPPYGRREIEFEQSHLIFLLTNHRPHAPVDDYAFWKRIRNIPFNQSFVDDPRSTNEHKVDKNISVKLKAEATGILRWMVEGCLIYQCDGLNDPPVVCAAAEEYRRSEDTLQEFIDENCIVGTITQCAASKLYQHYKLWANEGGMRPMSQTAFGRQMTSRGFDKRKSGGITYYHGIGLISQKGGNFN